MFFRNNPRAAPEGSIVVVDDAFSGPAYEMKSSDGTPAVVRFKGGLLGLIAQLPRRGRSPATALPLGQPSEIVLVVEDEEKVRQLPSMHLGSSRRC